MLLKRSLGFSLFCTPLVLLGGLGTFGSMLVCTEGLGLGILMLVGGALDAPFPQVGAVDGLSNSDFDAKLFDDFRSELVGGLLAPPAFDVPSEMLLFFAAALGDESLTALACVDWVNPSVLPLLKPTVEPFGGGLRSLSRLSSIGIKVTSSPCSVLLS